MTQETKVGLFLIAAMGVILTSILFLGKIKLFRHSHSYFVDFANVEALPTKAAVKVAGVEVGKVDKVELVEGRARVTISLDPKVVLHRDAVVRIGSTGIIGTRFVEVFPGSAGSAALEENAVIQGVAGGSLEAMMSKLSGLFDDDPEHGGNAVDNLKESLRHIRNVTAALDSSMGQRSEDLNDIVSNIKDLTYSAKVFAAHLQEISTEHKEDVKVALEKFRGVGEKLDAILAKINNGEGTIGTLVSDKKTEQDVKEAIASVKQTAAEAKKVIGRFTMINTYWNYRYRYDARDDEGRNDIGITFVPRPGKYYALGVENVGDPVPDEKHVAFERKNRFTATLGTDWGPFTGYAGVIHSDGGVGLNFRPLWKSAKWGRRVELQTQAYDFDRDMIVKNEHLKGSVVSAGLHVALTRWWWVGVRGQDLFQHAAFQSYTNLVFRDEDLAYLLGFASFAR